MKKSMISAFIAVGMAVTISAPAAAKTDEEKFIEEGFVAVDAESIGMIGRWDGVNTKGKRYKFELIDGGTATFRMGSRRSAGRWSIEEGKLCTAWKEFRPRKRCDKIYKRDDEYRGLKPDGKSSGSISKDN